MLDFIGASSLCHRTDQIAQYLESSVRIGVRRIEPGELAVGASRFGGLPDLPSNVEWPRLAGQPMEHLAQFYLPEVSRYDVQGLLPKTGWLCFFCFHGAWWAMEGPKIGRYEVGGEPIFRALYFDAGANELTRTEPPERPDPVRVFRSCGMAFATELTLPNLDSPSIKGLGLSGEEREAYGELVLEMLAPPPMPAVPKPGGWRRWFAWLESKDCGHHRMLGHPDDYDVAPEMEWQYEYEGKRLAWSKQGREERSRQWLLLLQLGPEEKAKWMWSDCGYLYFGIRQEDLRASNFDDVELATRAA